MDSVSLSSPDFSILYIHYFVYTVYDDFSGRWCCPGQSGQSPTTNHTHLTATETETDTGEQNTSFAFTYFRVILFIKLNVH